MDRLALGLVLTAVVCLALVLVSRPLAARMLLPLRPSVIIVVAAAGTVTTNLFARGHLPAPVEWGVLLLAVVLLLSAAYVSQQERGFAPRVPLRQRHPLSIGLLTGVLTTLALMLGMFLAERLRIVVGFGFPQVVLAVVMGMLTGGWIGVRLAANN